MTNVWIWKLTRRIAESVISETHGVFFQILPNERRSLPRKQERLIKKKWERKNILCPYYLIKFVLMKSASWMCVSIHTRVHAHVYIYIYIYCHPQTDCFVVSPQFSVATCLPSRKLYKLDEPDTLLEKQGRTHQGCTPMDPRIWPSKSRTTSSNIHTAAMWGYGM